MSKTAVQTGDGSHHLLPGEKRASSFVSLSASTPAAAVNPTMPTQTRSASEYTPRPSSYKIRNLNPSTAILGAKAKTATFRQQEEDFSNAETETSTPHQQECESVPPPTPAPTPVLEPTKALIPPMSAPTSPRNSPPAKPAPVAVEATASEQKAKRQASPPLRRHVARPNTHTEEKDKEDRPLEHPNTRIVRIPQKRAPMPMITISPIPEEPIPESLDPEGPSNGFEDLKLGLQALLKKVDVLQSEVPDPDTLAEKEQEIERLQAYIFSLEARHKKGRELVLSRDMHIMQLQGQLTVEQSSAAFYKGELESYKDERAGFEEKMKKSKQAVKQLKEEKRQMNEGLYESENNNKLLYEGLAASKREENRLAELLVEANGTIKRLRDEKADDARYIKKTLQHLAEPKAGSSLLRKGADVSSPPEAVDAKKMVAIDKDIVKERSDFAEIFGAQTKEIARLQNELMDLEIEIRRCQHEKDKHSEIESVNHMLRTQVTFLKFQQITSSRKTTKLECELIDAKKSLDQLKNATGTQEGLEYETKSRINAQSRSFS